ncbi:putative acyl-CoA dehydrogenase [Rhodobacteraceae bacterium MBR-64]
MTNPASPQPATPRPPADDEVFNQPCPPGDIDLWAADIPLREATARHGGDAQTLAAYGASAGTARWREAARAANRQLPELHTHDRGGRRRDVVTFHPAYHDLLHLGLGAGYAGDAWTGGSHVTHAAMVYLHSQVEPGTCCPMTMTYAAVPALAANPALAAIWQPRLTARGYDPACVPVTEKSAATLGMAMTEKQGGSDLRSNQTQALPDGEAFRLTGHKWFCSAPMSDGFLTLAQAPGGLTCFLVPRWLDGGTNAIHLMRLKDKLGNRANASAEIEYHGAFAHRIGEEGDGVRTIIAMVHHTRRDTAMAPAGLMRAALAEAAWWCAGRSVFQRRLIDQPLMRRVLADLALDLEGAVALGFFAASTFDGTSDADRALARVVVALAKFLSNKRCPPVVYEAMETLGGMGYVEETPLPLLYREAPLNSIWEGSGNVICLDILRTLAKVPLANDALQAELQAATGADHRYDAALAAHRARWPGRPDEGDARWFADSAARLLAASLLIRNTPGAVADGWCASRLDAARGMVSGAISGLDEAALIARIGAP